MADKEDLRLRLRRQALKERLSAPIRAAPGDQPSAGVPPIPAPIQAIETQPAARGGSIPSIIQGVTLGGGDELAGVAAVVADQILGAVGEGSGQPAGQVFEASRAAQQQAISDTPAAVRVPAEIVGGVATGGPVARAAIGTARGLPAAARALTAGIGEGAVAGALSAPPGERAKGAALGAGIGTVLGVAVPLTVAGLNKAIMTAFRNPEIKKLGKAGRDAAKRVMEAFRNDDITVDQAVARLNRLGPQSVVADVGEENVRGVAQAVTGTAGRGRRQAGRVLGRRSQGAPRRVTEAIREVTSGENADDVAAQIIRQRGDEARPLYERALAVGEIDDPAINRLIGSGNNRGSSVLRNAIREAKELDPELADLPDNSMTLLDRAYKAIGGQANAARRAGDGVRANSLDDIRMRLRDRLVELNPAYGEALDTFSDQSNLLDALELGRDAFKPKAGVTANLVSSLPESERAMFKIGLADALVDQVERGVPSSSARRLLRTPKIQGQIKAAFGDDVAGAREFRAQLLRELEFAKTANIATGSRTAPLAREISRLGEAVDVADAAIDVASGAPARSILSIAKRALGGSTELSPEMNDALGRILFTPAGELNTTAILRAIQAEDLARAARGAGGTAAGIGAGAGSITEANR